MNLTTTYLGFELAHPVVPSASPLTEHIDTIRQLEDAGAPAIVLHSLFEEQIIHESLELHHYSEYGTESFAEALSYLPELDDYKLSTETYLELIRQAKDAIGVPIIASLNGSTPGGWTQYARQMEEAGSDGLELNIYYVAADHAISGGEVERMYLDVLTAVRETVSIPIAVKLSPFISSLANFAKELEAGGANGLVLFNRFYQPDVDLETLEVVPNLQLSRSDEMRLPLRWISILCGNVACDLAASTGVHTAQDALKYLMVGADVTMTTSALLQKGPGHIRTLVDGITTWMEENEYESVEQLKGSMSREKVSDPAQFERANYMKVLQSLREYP
ncbi:MAG: dihydroorotate dehydrogenase-like protein [Fidelibacterota bacterium]|nr:MAG: dihydroorotate dehydrogenase-like protein [Candidatus Neomarinimicrobiota bacterium]